MFGLSWPLWTRCSLDERVHLTLHRSPLTMEGRVIITPTLVPAGEMRCSKVEAPRESSVVFQAQMNHNLEGTCATYPAAAAAAPEKAADNHVPSSRSGQEKNCILGKPLLCLHRMHLLFHVLQLSVLMLCQCRKPRNLNWKPFKQLEAEPSCCNYIRMATSLLPRKSNNAGGRGPFYY